MLGGDLLPASPLHGLAGTFIKHCGPRVLLGLPLFRAIVRRVIAGPFFPAPQVSAPMRTLLIQVLAPRITPMCRPDSVERIRSHGANVARSAHVQRIAFETWWSGEIEIMGALGADTFCLSAPPWIHRVGDTPTLMAYATARFRSDPRSRRSTRRSLRTISEPCRGCPMVLARIACDANWLFRRSFAFVYGQTRTKEL